MKLLHPVLELFTDVTSTCREAGVGPGAGGSLPKCTQMCWRRELGHKTQFWAFNIKENSAHDGLETQPLKESLGKNLPVHQSRKVKFQPFETPVQVFFALELVMLVRLAMISKWEEMPIWLRGACNLPDIHYLPGRSCLSKHVPDEAFLPKPPGLERVSP